MSAPEPHRTETRETQARRIELSWQNSPRWEGVERTYSAEDVVRLRGSFEIRYSIAERGAEKLWRLLHERPYVNALGALTGNQALQQV